MIDRNVVDMNNLHGALDGNLTWEDINFHHSQLTPWPDVNITGDINRVYVQHSPFLDVSGFWKLWQHLLDGKSYTGIQLTPGLFWLCIAIAVLVGLIAGMILLWWWKKYDIEMH